MFKKVCLLLLISFVLPINIRTQNPAEENSGTDSYQKVVESPDKAVSPENSTESYYQAKLKELENNETARQAKEFRENIDLGLYAVNTALNVSNTMSRLYNYLRPSKAKKAEDEKAENLITELRATRLLSVCMRTHVEGELDEKFHMPKACEKEVKDLLSVNPQILAEKQHAFNYMRR